MKVTYIGHATLLLELGGATILTDPNFDPRLGRILPRVSAPGIALEKLPSLDAILLTHAHADHLSFDSLERLPRTIPVYAPPVIARWLQRLGFDRAVELAPGNSVRVKHVTVHAAAATHRGNRYGYDRWRSDANMYLLDAGETIFFAGDTALVDDTHHLVERVLWKNGRELDLALLPIGYAPWWKPGFRKGHLTHEDALTLFERLRAKTLVPYHWGTFRHVTATAHDAINRLRQRLLSHHLSQAVKIIEPGESLQTPHETPREATRA
jgi:L-ascorbate metabolism protein UlaG (beta-lactamase superfamily)